MTNVIERGKELLATKTHNWLRLDADLTECQEVLDIIRDLLAELESLEAKNKICLTNGNIAVNHALDLEEKLLIAKKFGKDQLEAVNHFYPRLKSAEKVVDAADKYATKGGSLMELNEALSNYRSDNK